MAVVTYFICYVPAIIYAMLRRDTIHSWSAFLAAFCTFFSSASNPIIYVFRNRKYRAAIRQLVKDPCGRSPFQEKPVINGKEEKQPQTSSRNEVGGPGTSITHEKHTEREAYYYQRRSRAESKVPHSCNTVKIAWQARENDSEKTGPDRFDAEEKGKGQQCDGEERFRTL